MRVDLFLKCVGVTKTRMEAKRLCDREMVLLEGKPLKPSHELLAGELLELRIPGREKSLRVLAIPPGKSVSKKDRPLFAEWVV